MDRVNEQRVVLEYNNPQAQRLDKYLVACLGDYSRSRLQALIKAGHVLVNGLPADKTGQMLEGRATIEVHVPPPEPVDLAPEAIPLQIIFENGDLIVIDKPAGMVVHPAAGHRVGTLVHAALAHAPDIEGVGGRLRPGVVHRLDKDTSGIIIFAKNDRTHRRLQDQFRQRSVKKAYLALVDGAPPTPTGRIEAAVGRDSKARSLMAVVPDEKGRSAVTEYHTREVFQLHTLLEVFPLTGRTHQIRVHLRFIGCPVAGDTVYGRKRSTIPLNRHFLHAQRLEIRLPGETQLRIFEAPLPPELVDILESLKK
jgi:23S rRNA pseudouridine1911/1915/1917 synthase